MTSHKPSNQCEQKHRLKQLVHGVDLFCGVGGLTHGLAKGGIRVIAGVDLDPHCRFPYEKNNKATFVERDISKLTGNELLDLFGNSKLRLLAGCAPCQPFSTYSQNSRRFKNNDKWDLVAEFSRLIAESQPDFVTMENVPQLLDHAVFEKFLNSLKDYHFRYEIVDCRHYDVPQSRRRLVLIASRFGPIQLLPPHRSRKQAKTVSQAISYLPILAAGCSDPDDPLHSASALSDLNLRRIQASKPGGTWRDWDESLIAECHRKKSGKTYSSVYGRMEWDSPSPTITTQCFGYGNGRFGHPEQDRAISLREAAILQTFPKSYQFLSPGEKVNFSKLGRLIGNAVPVRLGEIVAKSICSHLESVF